MTRPELIARLEAVTEVLEHAHLREAADTVTEAIKLIHEDAFRIHQLNEELLNVRADPDMIAGRLFDRS